MNETEKIELFSKVYQINNKLNDLLVCYCYMKNLIYICFWLIFGTVSAYTMACFFKLFSI